MEGNLDTIRAEVLSWYEEAVRLWDEEVLPDLALLVWRAGLLDSPPDALREPEVNSITGRHREAAAFWSSAGAPYKAAWALLDSDDEVDLREARAMFDRLGASVLVERTDAKLRSIGAKVPRGARARRARTSAGSPTASSRCWTCSTRACSTPTSLRGCTWRRRLSHTTSRRSSRKLGVSSRLEAVRRARDLTAAG